MRRTRQRSIFLLGVLAVASLVTAPVAFAAQAPSCVATGGTTECLAPGDVQIYAAPHNVSGAVGHSDPKWIGLGYNPKWDGFDR